MILLIRGPAVKLNGGAEWRRRRGVLPSIIASPAQIQYSNFYSQFQSGAWNVFIPDLFQKPQEQSGYGFIGDRFRIYPSEIDRTMRLKG